jgi:hypothetical protein
MRITVTFTADEVKSIIKDHVINVLNDQGVETSEEEDKKLVVQWRLFNGSPVFEADIPKEVLPFHEGVYR